MGSLVAAVGALWIAVIMWDAFEAIVLPRRVTRRLRPARMFYRGTWRGGGSGGTGKDKAGIPAPAQILLPLFLLKKKKISLQQLQRANVAQQQNIACLCVSILY